MLLLLLGWFVVWDDCGGRLGGHCWMSTGVNHTINFASISFLGYPFTISPYPLIIFNHSNHILHGIASSYLYCVASLFMTKKN